MNETDWSAEACVARGVEKLDALNPDWFKKANPETLIMSSGTSCVLGQVYGGYWHGCEVLELGDVLYENGYTDTFYHGFDSRCGHNTYASLRTAWIAAINERNSKVGA